MPDKKGRLTPMERTFAKHAAATGDNHYAAHKAGYSFPNVMGPTKASNPAIQAEIARQQLEMLWTRGLGSAVKAHIEMIESASTPAGARVQAVKLMYEQTLNVRDAAQGKAPHEMTAEELAKAISEAKLQAAALENIKAERASPIIEHEPAKPDLFD